MSELQPRRWTRQEYERMTDAGVLTERERVAEYWIVNLIESVVEIYRDPTEDGSARFGWSYAQSKRLGRTDLIPVPFGGVVSVADLLP